MKTLFEDHTEEQEHLPSEMPSLEADCEMPELPEAPETAEELYPVPMPPKRRVRPELILGLIAVLAAAVLIATVIACTPHFGRYSVSEDPEDILDRGEDEIVLPMPDQEPENQPPEEPENPTIPPDRNPYDQYDFQFDRHNYLRLQNLPSMAGVDVSAHQGAIDWKLVAGSGIEFAMVRLGYRGYGSGKLQVDDYVEENLRGAKKAGLKVGAYFFSQALTIQECEDEINFMLNILGDFQLDMPIVLDWEIPAEDARTANMDARTLTDIQLFFVETMRMKGYTPMVYFNWHQSENLYYLSELEQAPFWLALYRYRMTYPWKVEMWQYTSTGRVPGIQGNVDLNVYMPD